MLSEVRLVRGRHGRVKAVVRVDRERRMTDFMEEIEVIYFM